jgi:hypothetical protein
MRLIREGFKSKNVQAFKKQQALPKKSSVRQIVIFLHYTPQARLRQGVSGKAGAVFLRR